MAVVRAARGQMSPVLYSREGAAESLNSFVVHASAQIGWTAKGSAEALIARDGGRLSRHQGPSGLLRVGLNAPIAAVDRRAIRA